MRAGIAALAAAYVLSQFFRAFLAVLAPVMSADMGIGAQDLAQASGWWFLSFAVMQLPVGWSLDRFGPRWTSSILLSAAALGAFLFAGAQGPGAINLAMILIGAGCAPVLMSAYYIFARSFAPAVFGTLAGLMIGFGSLGNLAASVPLSRAVEVMGWRGTMLGLAAATLVVALGLAAFLRDPARVPGGATGSILDLLKIRALWPVLVMMAACYPAPSGLRGLWVGPWRADVFAENAGDIGRLTLVMGLAMVVGNFAYGPLDRILGTRKWLVFGGNALMLICLLALWQLADRPGVWPVVFLAGVGLFGASFPMVMAHGRAFLPPHLVGRGVTLINLFGIGMSGLMQMVTGRLHHAISATDPAAPYAGLFLFYAGLTAVGLLVYLFSRDRTD